jgi:carbamate kinase
MRIVVALGGNALLRRGQPMTSQNQQINIQTAAKAVATLAQDHDLIVVHGNGPQVGLLALQAEAYKTVQPYPLDILDAETEGMIGYLIEQELRNQLPDRQVVTLLTQVEVDGNDPARLAQDGYNQLPETTVSPLMQFLSHFWGPIAWSSSPTFGGRSPG